MDKLSRPWDCIYSPFELEIARRCRKTLPDEDYAVKALDIEMTQIKVEE